MRNKIWKVLHPSKRKEKAKWKNQEKGKQILNKISKIIMASTKLKEENHHKFP